MLYRPSQTPSCTLCFLGVGAAASPPEEAQAPESAASTLHHSSSPLAQLFPAHVVTDVFVDNERGKTYVTFASQEAADEAKNAWNGKVLPKGGSTHQVTIVYGLRYAPTVNPEPANVCTTATGAPSPHAHLPPGLDLRLAFVTEAEEEALLALVDGAAWDTSQVFRRTQHYGAAAIDFKARGLGQDAPATPIPPLCQALLQRARQGAGQKPWPSGPLADPFPCCARDQMTVNEYLPGDGIANHVDVHSLFEDGVLLVSLGAAYVMDFKQRNSPDKAECAVVLPRRSLLTLQGPARYQWSHGLASRKTDKVNGQLIPRARRVSLSFRRVRVGPCGCSFPETCDSRGVSVM